MKIFYEFNGRKSKNSQSSVNSDEPNEKWMQMSSDNFKVCGKNIMNRVMQVMQKRLEFSGYDGELKYPSSDDFAKEFGELEFELGNKIVTITAQSRGGKVYFDIN